ncbi:hypothetical protein [Arthrobacter sp. B1I2]|nr:hypothetical protein [Arthrobacter sp. B1I2]
MKNTGAELEQDRHGETVLSDGDCDFIRGAADWFESSHGEASSQRF